MSFDFQDGHPDLERVPSALSAREGVLVSIIVHLLVIIAVLLVPQLPFFKARAAAAKAAAEAARQAMLEKQQENRTFVFVQPKVELEPLRPPPPRAPLSDRDRTARLNERPPNPKNSQPFHRGNTPEFVEPSPPPQTSRNQAPAQPADPTPAESQSASRDRGAENALQFPDTGNRPPATSGAGAPPAGQTGPLGEALRNLSRYTDQNSFDNPNGGDINQFGPLQFDTKGVEFGPWIRRFVAQVKRNWFVPHGGDVAARPCRDHVLRPSQRRAHRRDRDRAVQRRLVQHRRRERAARLEPHRAAAAGVSGRQGVLHGHLLLQRDAAGAVIVPRVRSNSVS